MIIIIVIRLLQKLNKLKACYKSKNTNMMFFTKTVL